MVKGKKGLGKGIESLIEDYGVPQEIEKAEQPDIYLKISQVEPNRKQPRKNFDENAMEELTESVKQYGIIQPLIVRKKENYYEIIAGERRWRAAKMAGLKEVPVVIRNYTDEEIMEISLIENIQRENLNPIEEAMAYQLLIKEFHLKQEDIAARVSKSRTFITNAMRLLKLDDRVQNMLSESLITSGHARALLGIEDGDLQYETAMKVYDEGLSVREVERLVKKINTPPKEEKEEQPASQKEQYQLIYENAENKLKTIMGTKVNIRNKSNHKGKIEIEYYSLDELERLMELFDHIK
ncbi:MAG: ParB/RepB/Spo0J family partition protein [Lachnospiraceae bacterium]|jgi:ParB family chromosome partitioning protein|nr:ParB/RepB/Spo0J family partition protein [Lachnospiraceae bacterium]